MTKLVVFITTFFSFLFFGYCFWNDMKNSTSFDDTLLTEVESTYMSNDTTKVESADDVVVDQTEKEIVENNSNDQGGGGPVKEYSQKTIEYFNEIVTISR